MSKSNDYKTEFLGMNYSTAYGQLRRQILFHLVQRLNADICFRCNEKINSIEKFSIEHKKEWLYEDKELFWNLNNISFSHLSCNIKSARRLGHKRTRSENPNELWCAGCQKLLPKERFGINNKPNSKRKHRWICKECRKARNWEHKSRNKL